jgi:hypothetical protein
MWVSTAQNVSGIQPIRTSKTENQIPTITANAQKRVSSIRLSWRGAILIRNVEGDIKHVGGESQKYTIIMIE